MKTDRIQAFSDGIFSILITVIVLEFNIPSYSNGHLAAAVWQQWPKFFAYVLTFSYIGILWLFHHDMFSCIQATDAKLNVLNLISIFLTTLLSYSMSLLSESLVTHNLSDLQFSIIFYSLLALSISLSYLEFYHYLFQKSYLLTDHTIKFQLQDLRKYPLASCLIYLLALISTVFNVYAGLLFLVAGILFHGFAYWEIAKSA